MDRHRRYQGPSRPHRETCSALSQNPRRPRRERRRRPPHPREGTRPRFRADFDRYPVLVESDLFERVLCPRVHTKAVIADGKRAFVGSPNLTGAGMGAKHPDKRNFEAGFLTDEAADLKKLTAWVDELFLGEFCGRCRLRDRCPDPLDGD